VAKGDGVMEQNPHPILLQQLFFVRSVVIAVQGHECIESEIKSGPENSLIVSKQEGDLNRYQATMRTLFNQNSDKAYPYSVDMECVGFFDVDDTLTEEEAIRGVTITAHGVLYGAIREAIAWITGRQPYGPLVFGLSILKPMVSPATANS
jgi:preprotein translocase subunit SecB